MTDPLSPELRAELDAGLRALSLDATLAGPLLTYLALLARWNQTYNLTAIRDPREMVAKHLLDALAMLPFLDGHVLDKHALDEHVLDRHGTGAVETLADLGTGAGLPGIPLAIARPALQVTLVESNGKKARFMREALRQLGLGNARVVESRIEAFAAPGQFDAITARALATLPLILELGGHLLKPHGRLLAMKGAHPAEEIAALPAGWRLESAHPLTVPGLAAERHVIVVARAP